MSHFHLEEAVLRGMSTKEQQWLMRNACFLVRQLHQAHAAIPKTTKRLIRESADAQVGETGLEPETPGPPD